jgi:hypothetical protein
MFSFVSFLFFTQEVQEPGKDKIKEYRAPETIKKERMTTAVSATEIVGKMKAGNRRLSNMEASWIRAVWVTWWGLRI